MSPGAACLHKTKLRSGPCLLLRVTAGADGWRHACIAAPAGPCMGQASTVPPEHLAPLHGLLQLGPVHVGGPVEGEGPASRPARTLVGPQPAAGPCLAASTLGWAGPRGRPLPIARTAAAATAAATTAAAVAPVGVVVATTGGRPMRMPPAVVVPVRAALWWLCRAGARGSMPVVAAAPAPACCREVTGRAAVWCCLLVGVWPGRLLL